MAELEYNKITLRKFAVTMGIAFLVITIILLLKGGSGIILTLAVSGLFFTAALIRPGPLKYIYIVWMKFAFILGWFNTRLLLLLMFYLVFMPVGLIMRIFRIDLLDRRIDKNRVSYWINKDRKVFKPLDYERQF